MELSPYGTRTQCIYDITHGVGLAIITPRWMRYILSEKTVDKFVTFAQNVWGLSHENDKYSLANKGIDALEIFFKRCGIPMTLTELGIDRKHFKKMAEDAVTLGNLSQAYVPLNVEDVCNIFEMCL